MAPATATPDRLAERRWRAMGTVAQVVVTGRPGTGLVEHLLDRAAARIDDLEQRWSRFRPDSELSRLATTSGAPTLVSSDTFLLVQQACAAWQLTGGRFDPTVTDAVEALGYDRDLSRLDRVDPSVVADARRVAVVPGCVDVVLDGVIGAVTLPRGVRLDPGGIGKGLAADLVVGELLDAGAPGALVNLGGDLRLAGEPPTGAAWSVSVDDPADRRRTLATVSLLDGAIATSSTLGRRWRRADGTVAHHVVDPASGAPADAALVTATVVAGEAWWAEALATALLTDPAAPTALADRFGPGGASAAALVVGVDGAVRAVGSLDPFLVTSDDPGSDPCR